MILTVTMNPSIDVSYPLDQLNIDTVNRIDKVSKTAGGKGLNVSRVLSQLNAPLNATGVIGGKFGDYLTEQLDKDGIPHSFSKIAGETRSCNAILHQGKQTEILESGPEVSKEEQAAFVEHFETLMADTDFITISGSLPKGIGHDFYSLLIEKATKADVKVLLDTSGATLKTSIENDFKPFLIKPNETEIADLLGKEINSDAELIEALEDSEFDGIEWVVVTLGADGAIVKHQKDFYRVQIPTIKVVNPVGSGDSTIAGLAYALSEGKSPKDVIKSGMVTGMLNTQEEKTGFINVDNFDELFDKITVEKI